MHAPPPYRTNRLGAAVRGGGCAEDAAFTCLGPGPGALVPHDGLRQLYENTAGYAQGPADRMTGSRTLGHGRLRASPKPAVLR